MNRRCFGQFNSQWIRLITGTGPFHRQYHAHLDLDRADYISGIETVLTGYDNLDEPKQTRRYQYPCASQPLQCRHQYTRNGKQRLVDQQSNRQQIDSRHSTQKSYNGSSKEHRSGLEVPLHGGTRLPRSRSQSQKHPIPMRLLWFRPNQIQQPKISTLLNRFGNEGMDIQIVDASDADTPVHKFVCEMIMLECIDTVEHDMLVSLNIVRAGSQVPLIVLTNNHTLDWSLLALREGADAIFTLNTPDDIIIARSNALLRRWISD